MDSAERGTNALAAIGILLAGALAWITIAQWFAQPRPLAAFHHMDFRCHPGDRSTINGRDLCPPHGAPR